MATRAFHGRRIPPRHPPPHSSGSWSGLGRWQSLPWIRGASFHRLYGGVVAVFFVLIQGACNQGTGHVELDWVVVDRDLRAIFPKSGRSSTCNIPGVDADGRSEVFYDLQIRLRAFACQADESPAQCQKRPPTHAELFDCDRARGTIFGLASQEAPYLFVVDTRMKAQGYGEWTPRQSCVAHAGPRLRKIRAGKMINLAVYQFVVQSSDEDPLSIPSCVRSQVKEGDTSGTGAGSDATKTAADSNASTGNHRR